MPQSRIVNATNRWWHEVVDDFEMNIRKTGCGRLIQVDPGDGHAQVGEQRGTLHAAYDGMHTLTGLAFGPDQPPADITTSDDQYCCHDPKPAPAVARTGTRSDAVWQKQQLIPFFMTMLCDIPYALALSIAK